MTIQGFIELYQNSDFAARLRNLLEQDAAKIHIKGLTGSSAAVWGWCTNIKHNPVRVFLLPDRETAAYFFNDLENLAGERELPYEKRHIFMLPSSYKRPYESEEIDNANVLLRAEVLNRLTETRNNVYLVTHPEALSEKVITKNFIRKNTLNLKVNEAVSVDFIIDLLNEYGFESTDFVVEPGQFSIRGGIIDVFSYSNDYPYRIEIMGDEVASLRSFDPENQLSIERLSKISILPDFNALDTVEKRESFLEFIPQDSVLWIADARHSAQVLDINFEKATAIFQKLSPSLKHTKPEELFLNGETFENQLQPFRIISFGKKMPVNYLEELEYKTAPQPSFNKNFDLLLTNLAENQQLGIKNIIFSDNSRQLERIESTLEIIREKQQGMQTVSFDPAIPGLHEGYIDYELKMACYTDHQIFERYHRFRLRDKFPGKQAMTLKELYNLKPGDYVTHINHGIGIFRGLEKIMINGREQEAIRLEYKENDLLYVSIHGLHRISRYVAKDGTPPTLHRLGSPAWNNLKNKTKQKVKDIARDLIALYAKRKAQQGHAFMPDTYLQNELEASFIYEDTPDQVKATVDVKADMENEAPMDRLICGDVGFGKTEIAIRAAFKAVTDSKQVAILVPTTILALQHFKTFSERLKDFPCTIDYINRFKSAKQIKETLEKLKDGKVDILIGTHRLLSADVKFKDLGLLVVDEEQKFGVAAKEKLKKLRTNVDTLTLTATPIPRTLQFSLMGARDLSIINTPPPNRYPIVTEVHVFNEELIRDAIRYELARGGQVFFIHNRVQNIPEVAGMIQRLLPDARIAIGHGQMDGDALEEVMLDFIDGATDVLVATTIIESGLDIPNANTIIINNANTFGLSDLHQMRGRVGRSNKKAFCYLLAPPPALLTDEARRRLKAIEEFSDLGSGFNISMRDLDIRGAGNLLGGEQSGFIAEIGFEMYHKILDEAIQELKDTEFKDLFASEREQQLLSGSWKTDSTLETDLKLLIPTQYVSSVEERLILYKTLDEVQSESGLELFLKNLEDRFGPVPSETYDLMDAVRLRWLSAQNGIEKMVLKSGKMVAHFISDPESPFYKSERFISIMQYIQKNHRICKMKQTTDKLTLSMDFVDNIQEALKHIKAWE